MKKTIKINGMMCGHCERKVKDALSEIGEVETVSHTDGKAILNTDKDDNTIKKVIEDLDFEVVEIINQ